MNTTNGGGSYDNGLPITLEGDEPLTTPNEAARTAVKAALAIGILVALAVIFAAPHCARLFTN